MRGSKGLEEGRGWALWENEQPNGTGVYYGRSVSR